MTPRLTLEEVDALLADKERALKRAQRQRRESPDDPALEAAVAAAKDEKRAVTLHSQMMAKGWVLACPAEHLDAMRAPTRDAYVRLMDLVALVNLFSVKVRLTEQATVELVIRAARQGVPSAIPGIWRAEKMRYDSWYTEGEAPTPQEALALAFAQVVDEL